MMTRTAAAIAAILVFLAISGTALADDGGLKPTLTPGIEWQNGEGGSELQLSLMAGFSASRVVGGSCFSLMLTENKYAEMICGPAFMADENLEISFYTGVDSSESDSVPLVGGTSVYLTGEAGDLFAFAQYGYDGFWYTSKARSALEHHHMIHFGLMSQRYTGEGLYMDFVPGRFTIYTAWLYGIEKNLNDRTDMGTKYITALFGLNAFID